MKKNHTLEIMVIFYQNKLLKYYRAIRAQNNPVKFVIARFLMRTKISKFFIIKQKHYRLRFYPTKISRELWIDPKFWEKNWSLRNNFFWNYLKKDDVVIDTGSHIGQVTIESAIKVENNGKVYSIEPDPTLFKYLQGNAKLNKLDNIIFYNFALGEKNSIMKFISDPIDPACRISNEPKNGIDIIVKKLDDLKIEEVGIDLLKLYGVGFEKYMLLGSIKTLKKTKCVHFRTYAEDISESYNYNYSDVFKILIENNFKIFQIQKNCKIIAIKELDKLKFDKKNISDFVAIKDLPDFISRTGFKIEE